MSTEMLFLRDAYLTNCEAVVREVEALEDGGFRVALDRTVFYPTGGGQPYDTGWLRGGAAGDVAVTAVRKEGPWVWHTVEASPKVGDVVRAEVDWDRRHRLMRTHSALHVLCGVIWNEWGVPVTGGNMEPLSARMDFELDPTPEGFGPRVEELVAAEIGRVRVVKTESKGKGNKRVRIAVEDLEGS